MEKQFYFALFVVLATVNISTTLGYRSGIDFEGSWNGPGNSLVNLQYYKTLADEIDKTAKNRVKINLETDHDRVYDTVTCARCIKNNINSYTRSCSRDCQPVVRAAEGSWSGAGNTVCRSCLHQAVTENAFDCTYQCTTQQLNHVLYSILK